MINSKLVNPLLSSVSKVKSGVQVKDKFGVVYTVRQLPSGDVKLAGNISPRTVSESRYLSMIKSRELREF